MDNTTNVSPSIFTSFTNYLPNLIYSLLIMLLFYAVAKYVSNYFSDKTTTTYEEELRKKKVNLAIYQIKDIIYYIILAIGVVLAVKQLGFESATLVTVVGLAGFTLSLALQGTITSLTSGVYLSSMNLFDLGDEITIIIPTTQRLYKGIVKDFNLFYTTLYTRDSQFISIPNNLIQTNMVSKK